MGYAQDEGYTPDSIADIMEDIRTGINTQFGTSYTEETFVGTNFYKYFYVLAQKVQTNEIKLSEIFLKLQDYFNYTNETIINPKVTPEGIIQVLADADYTASVKPPEVGDAGKLYVCVNVDDGDPDYADMKLEICNILKDNTAAGCVTQGTESETLTLTNGQSFDFKYNLPDITEIYLKLTVTTSRNNQLYVDTSDEIKTKLLAKIDSLYSLGLDFEPERYFTTEEAPYASDIKLEWSDDDITYTEDIFEAEYDDLLDYSLERLTVIQV